MTRLDAVVLGISGDDADTLKRFGQSCGVPFNLAADPGHAVARAYDTRRRFNLGTSRVTYVIDKQGVVRAAFHSEVSMDSHTVKALEALSALQA